MRQVIFCDEKTAQAAGIRYAVLAARYQGKWVFCRHRERDTWEIPGGHVAPGETPAGAARRELWEETGALQADITPVAYYQVDDYGALFFAEIRQLGPLPADFEMAELSFGDALPDALTYPDIQPPLWRQVQGWLNTQTARGEPWDVYDGARRLTGRIMRRGDPIAPGDYHLVVYIWTRNAAGEYLLTKRDPRKGFGNLWECTGGSAQAGEDSLTAAIREVREETGLVLEPARGERIYSYRREDAFCDVWLFQQEFDLAAVTLQPGETVDVRTATRAQILSLHGEKQLVPYRFFDAVFPLL